MSDGDAELLTVPILLKRTTSPHTVVRVLRTDLQITTSMENVAAKARKGMIQLRRLGAEAVVVMLDREKDTNCPPRLARDMSDRLRRAFAGFVLIEVVIKDQMFENWLIGDTSAIENQAARFALSSRVKAAVNGGRADQLDAQTILKEAAINGDYAKIRDAQKIAQLANPHSIARASRSFRRLLRVSGDPAYAKQSKNPNIERC